MSVLRYRFAALTGLVLLLTPLAAAGPITVFFRGRVNSEAIKGCGVLVNCGVVTGTYNSASADLNPDPATGLYAATSITFSIDGVPFFSSSNGLINVANFLVVDQYGLLATGVAANGSPATLSILLSGAAATFTSDALPANSNALTPLLPGTFQLNASDDKFQLLGSIDFVLIDATPPVIVPTINGTIGPDGPYISDVTVTWSVSDPESGIALSTGCSPRTLTEDTPGTTLTCSATNGVGLTNSVSVTIKIDKHRLRR